MTWPNTTVSTTHLDAGTDEPRLARADLKDAVDKLNTIITDGPTRGFVEISTTGTSKNLGGNFYRANVQTNYQTGPTIINRITDNGELEFSPGLYLIDLVDSTGTGQFNLTSNTGAFSYSCTSVTYVTPGTGITATFSTVPSNSFIKVDSVSRANINYTSTGGTLIAPTVMRFTRFD